MNEFTIAEPQSITDVELLIKSLYGPSSPNAISAIEVKLQSLQKSPDGWQLAEALLTSNDEKVRFFGALTFTVKLNLDWSVNFR